MTSINVTSIRAYLADLLRLGSSIIFVQEHALPLELQAAFINNLRKINWDASLSPLPNTTLAPSAGVGILVKSPHTILPTTPSTDMARHFMSIGRLSCGSSFYTPPKNKDWERIST